MCMTGWVNAWVTVGWVDEVKPLVERDMLACTLRELLSGTVLQTARFGYATEGALFSSVQLSSDVQRPPKGLGTDKTGSNIASKHARKHEARLPRVNKKFSLD